MKSENIDYYNNNSKDFISKTKDADLSDLRMKFAGKIPDGSTILDLGCGSGRDSIAFKKMGYDVYAMDASEKLVEYCETFLGERVECATFENYDSNVRFDGIWACASLIHADKKDLCRIIHKYSKVLKDKGLFYMSFKKGEEDYNKDGRSFTCFNPDTLENLLKELNIFSNIEIFETFDARPGRKDEKWVNAFAIKDYSKNCITGDKNHLLPDLRKSIGQANRIDIIVAFLMESGVRVLVEDLKNAAFRGAVIRILCGNYLNITQPAALFLLKEHLGNDVDLRFYSNKNKSFHPKAYIFSYKKHTEIYVGSSNISFSALTDGIEWNYRLNSLANPEDCEVFTKTFEDLFLNHSVIINDKEMREYSKNWKKPPFLQHMILAEEKDDYRTDKKTDIDGIKPTDAQIEALYELKKSREDGWDKGLVVAATGIGKTFLAAFDSKEYKKILFLAHREEILYQAKNTFEKVRPDLKFGIFNGNQKNMDFDVLFASVQTLGKPEYLSGEYFKTNAFEYIIVDEFHHAVAKSYKNVLGYFKPRFLLGLTATPERLDNKDVFALCDHHIVYEARLKEAIQKGWLVPFRYYGVYDDTTNYDDILYRNGSYDDEQLEKALSKEKRADAILGHYKKYHSRRALGFCSGRMHACYMAKYFLDEGIPACAVISGSLEDDVSFDSKRMYLDVIVDRKEALKKLKDGTTKIIFSVDMFNEGVDIPSLDMVLFLRPTESPTVFMQQLGRGLRWDKNKKYLNILDFIGNYKNACLIPAFLASAVSSYDRKINISVTTLRDTLPEECLVDFDLKVIDIFKEMQKKQMKLKEKIVYEYSRVKKYMEERPMRLSMYTYIDDDIYLAIKNRTKINLFNDYLLFLKSVGDITPSEEKLLSTKAHTFLKKIETTDMKKLYKIPVLLSFIQGEKLIPVVGEKEIVRSYRSFYSNKSNAVDLLKDKKTENYSEWDDQEYFKLAIENPIHFLCKSSEEFFTFQDNRLYLSGDLSKYLSNPDFVRHFKDILDYRARRFYKERLEDKT